ncbi:hypothetical protein D9M70_477360 [compost metagenome]
MATIWASLSSVGGIGALGTSKDTICSRVSCWFLSIVSASSWTTAERHRVNAFLSSVEAYDPVNATTCSAFSVRKRAATSAGVPSSMLWISTRPPVRFMASSAHQVMWIIILSVKPA